MNGVLEQEREYLVEAAVQAPGAYVFREVKTRRELVEMFRVRYRVHREAGYIDENADGLDIDCYDLHSRFLGVWLPDGGGERMVASMRIVLPGEESPLFPLILQIASNAGDTAISSIRRPDHYFPTEEAFGLTSMVEDILSGGERVVELSRTTKLAEVRDLRLVYALSYGSCALARACGASYALGSGEMQTCRLYKMIGGAQILEHTARVHPTIGVNAVAIKVDLDRVAPQVREIIDANLKDLQTRGFWTVPIRGRDAQERRVSSSDGVRGALLASISPN